MQDVIDNIETAGLSAVMFCDGSARPNPGNRGCGLHGYVYTDELPKRGSGNSTHYPSAVGYIPKTIKDTKDAPKEVSVVKYIDLYESCIVQGSNNLSEVEAATHAFRIALELGIKKLTIYTDSEYVRKGVYDWSPAWIRNDWIKQDGTEVTNADAWKKLLAKKIEVTEKEIEFQIIWVKGHKDSLGNIIADKLAEIGVMNAIYGSTRQDYELSNPQGYWKTDVEKHPFICNSRLYFNTVSEYNTPGVYYMGSHGGDDTLLGSQMVENTHAVIRLKHPEPIIEDVRKMVIQLSQNENSIMMVKIDHLYNPTIYKELTRFGKAAILRNNVKTLDLSTLDEEPLAVEIKPPRLAQRTIDRIGELNAILSAILENDIAEFTIQDITNKFYHENAKTGKFQLNDNLNKPGVSIIELPLTYKGKEVVSKFSLGSELPDRNTLKRLEEHKPTVKLISWYESDYVMRYAIMIEADGNYGIWASPDTNLRFVEP